MNRISLLWHSGNESEWQAVLEGYWHCIKPANLDLEKEMNSLNRPVIAALGAKEWFLWLLQKYFPWKYTQLNRLATTTKYLKRYEEDGRLGELYEIKQELFSIEGADIRSGLRIAKQIKGLGVAGASGLLAVFSPESFGTADQFVVKSLCAIADIENREQIVRMKPDSLRLDDAVLLIGIMRRKAQSLNPLFQSTFWTPRKIDMVLWTASHSCQ